MSCSLAFMGRGVFEREDGPMDRMRLRIGCSTVVISCCRSGHNPADAAPVLGRRPTRRLTERAGEARLVRKSQRQRNIGQRLVVAPEQLLGAIEPLRTDIAGRRPADGGFERTAKMEFAQ